MGAEIGEFMLGEFCVEQLAGKTEVELVFRAEVGLDDGEDWRRDTTDHVDLRREIGK